MTISDSPVTETEFEALRAVGLDALRREILCAYRAGFRDGSLPPETRVFREGDPEPGPEVTAVVDEDGDTWKRQNGASWILDELTALPWDELLDYGPLVAGLPVRTMSDYDAAVDADAERRAAEQVAGGAQ